MYSLRGLLLYFILPILLSTAFAVPLMLMSENGITDSTFYATLALAYLLCFGLSRVWERRRSTQLRAAAVELGFQFYRNKAWHPFGKMPAHPFFAADFPLFAKGGKPVNIFYDEQGPRIFGFFWDDLSNRIPGAEMRTVFAFKGDVISDSKKSNRIARWVPTIVDDWIVEGSDGYTILYKDSLRVNPREIKAMLEESQTIHARMLKKVKGRQ